MVSEFFLYSDAASVRIWTNIQFSFLSLFRGDKTST